MYRFLLLFILTSFFCAASAQKNDYIWMEGRWSNGHALYDSSGFGFTDGNIRCDFNQNPMQITKDSIGMNFDCSNTTMCDSDGNLLFYTNGIYVANALDEMIQNSDSLNAGYVQYVWDRSITELGDRNFRGIISIQNIANPNEYYLIHSFADTLANTNGNNVYFSKLLISLIDMSANNGRGSMIYKNQALIQDSLNSAIQCVRHGNGRDWWFLIGKWKTNCFYRVLLDSSGFHVMPDLNCLGTDIPFDQFNTSCFSPDGTKYIDLGVRSGLSIYDFDRCTGLLSNPKNLPIPLIIDSNWLDLGAAISPNSRFLYVSLGKQLYQFDLWANDPFADIDTVGYYNDTRLNGTPGVLELFDMQQLAPDGKIYMSCGPGSSYLHVIKNPDEKGALCNFGQDQIPLPVLISAVPNYPNYRLGSLTQGQCDSLTIGTQEIRDEKERILKVFPNPANDIATIDYGFTDWNKGAVSVEISNPLGQVVYTQQLPMYSGFQKIDVTQFAAGNYAVFIKRNNGVVAANKLVVVH